MLRADAGPRADDPRGVADRGARPRGARADSGRADDARYTLRGRSWASSTTATPTGRRSSAAPTTRPSSPRRSSAWCWRGRSPTSSPTASSSRWQPPPAAKVFETADARTTRTSPSPSPRWPGAKALGARRTVLGWPRSTTRRSRPARPILVRDAEQRDFRSLAPTAQLGWIPAAGLRSVARRPATAGSSQARSRRRLQRADRRRRAALDPPGRRGRRLGGRHRRRLRAPRASAGPRW